MKAIEITLWIAGAALLAMFAGIEAWGEIERQRDVAAFGQARQQAATNNALRLQPANLADTTAPADGIAPDDAVLAILRIPGIALEVPVSYGTDEAVLLRGAGLVEGTAMPGSDGNVGIAAHRDTHFRALKDLSLGDRIELALPDRTQFFVVTDLWVVEPTDIHVLDDTGNPVLTLVTCYPFYFVGNAPQRFIVRAVVADSST